MKYARRLCLLTLLALTATGCFSARPSRVQELAPDREVSEPQVPPRDSAGK